MLAARDQENLASIRQNGAALKQQQQGVVKRQPLPDTPGAVKVPLNDERPKHAVGGAKSIRGARTKGNENTLMSKGKSLTNANGSTPSEARSRAPLGDKTTNAKAKGQQTVKVKSAVREIETSQAKAPAAVRRPRKGHAPLGLQKLPVHAEPKDPLRNREQVEYCPPNANNPSWVPEVVPGGSLKVDPMKYKKAFEVYTEQFLQDRAEKNGVFPIDKELGKANGKTLVDCEGRIIGKVGHLELGVQNDLEPIKEDVDSLDLGVQTEVGPSRKKAPIPSGLDTDEQSPTLHRALSTNRAKKAAEVLSMDDTTKSMERKAVRSMELKRVPSKKMTSLPMPSLKRSLSTQTHAMTRKTSMEIEANSRTTIGYNKGRFTASILAQGTAVPKRPTSRTGLARSDTTLSNVSTESTESNDSDRTITPTLFAREQASASASAEQKVTFLSIFEPEDEDEYNNMGGNKSKCSSVDGDSIDFKLLD
ncbi:hypothetical protein GGR54DRAFT_46169 [Hypoxylon sp. NC1633]|nr:hypothetical protein GGR54DRAFT_46169 [Hypoxylon sp. NC1633]